MMINYRPISLLITTSKLLEKSLKFLEKHNIRYNSQYSFHNKHSCEHALMELSGKVIKAKYQGLHSTALFLDLSKAFDILDHSVLLKKLQCYRIRGIFLNWFRNYISNRSLVAKIQTNENKVVKSESYDIIYGMAQGSCLGPLLFSLFINEIYLLPTFSSIIPFSDDTSLCNRKKKFKISKLFNGT